ncbi:hypothetical protein MRB53_016465 [Persea americana]|uniref:Uncharacterized protein n=1 Tax=Persea americana TaxID=3435 RepID=A0ACC2M364_PERAE|nr:hypothetical protein MRB53_016465 [Persea americana]
MELVHVVEEVVWCVLMQHRLQGEPQAILPAVREGPVDEAKPNSEMELVHVVEEDSTSRMLIGAGERKDGLYFYHSVQDVKAFQAWKLFDLESEDLFVSRDVEFVETKFPFASKVPDCGEDIDRGDRHVVLVDECADDDCDAGRTCLSNQSLEVRGGTPHDETQILVETVDCTSGTGEGEGPATGTDNSNHLRRGHRIKQPLVKLRDYVTNTIRKLSPSVRSPTASHASGAYYPIAHYANCDRFSPQHPRFLVAVSAE